MSPSCVTVAAGRPSVWRDETDGTWVCQQFVRCLKCRDVWCNDLAEGVSWDEALAASINGIPFVDAVEADA
jgi:hypothetical protein